MSFSLSALFDSFYRFVRNAYSTLDALLEDSSRKRIMWAVVIGICGGIILLLNVLTPMIADDFGYLYVFGEKVQVSSLSDLVRSQSHHYMKWGGRSVVHFIAQALLQVPRLVADVLNTGVYLIFVSLIYFHIKGRDERNSLSIFVLINLAAWFVLPMFGDTVLWITGSANYLWGTTIILLFLLPYRRYAGSVPSGMLSSIFSSLGLFLFGVIAGWTNENTVAGMIVIIVLFLLYYRSQKWNIPSAFWLGLAGVVVGYVIMISAPGNFYRARTAPSLSLYLVLYRVFMYTKDLLLNYGVFLIFYGALLALLRKRRERLEWEINISLFYSIGAFISIYAMVVSPQFPARAWFGLVSYLIIAVGILLYRIDFKEKIVRGIRFVVILIACLAFIFSFYDATKDVYRVYQMDEERELIAKEARVENIEKCYFKRIVPRTSYVHGEDELSNLLLSYYYGIYVEYED